MKALALFLCLSSYVWSQTKSPVNSLRQAHSMGSLSIPILDDESHPVLFTLLVSWIPTHGNDGLFRYQLKAIRGYLSSDKIKSTLLNSDDQVFLRKVKNCSYTLILKDESDFDIAKFPIALHETIGAAGEIESVDENSSGPMTLDNYKTLYLLPRGDGWTLSWACPK